MINQFNKFSPFFQPISNADFIVPVEIDNVIHQVYVLKRPFVDEFLCRMGELFECVLFTASLAKVSLLPLPVRELISGAQIFTSNDDSIFLRLRSNFTESDRTSFNIHVQKVDIGFHSEAMTSMKFNNQMN